MAKNIVNGLSDIEMVALAKAISTTLAKKASGNLEAGEYEGHVLLDVAYALRRGENYTREDRRKANQILAAIGILLLGKVNAATREAVVQEALDLDTNSEPAKATKAEVQEVLDAMPAKTVECNGAVTGSVHVERVYMDGENEDEDNAVA